ncbi:integrase catalytic domain-containing protein [Trichonephila clavipes]|nr:integrase catalytic domain-containing protein [Trichonephila clavipes]
MPKNFVGANRELKRLQNLKFPEEKLSSEGNSWNFMPPRAPNFGGLWEAGVKSFKFYLKRAVGNFKMTLEEFLTIITQIEGILNSRPITLLSEDTDDLEVLTPGHFLIGRSITSISEPNLLDKSESTLSRWQKLAKILQRIWTKWSRDYLNNLQQRNKWQFHKDNVKLNTRVLIKDNNLPVNKWSLSRITKLFPDTDGKENGRCQRRSNLELCQSYKESDIVNSIKIQRIKWAGHAIRMNEDRTTKKVFNAQPSHEERAGQILDGLMAEKKIS